MSETLLLVTLLTSFALLLASFRLGKLYIYCYLAMLGGVMLFLVPVSVSVFGWPLALAEILFATFFLATDILSEHYGESDARKGVWILIVPQLIVAGLIHLAALFTPSDMDIGIPVMQEFATILPFMSLVVVFLILVIEQQLDIYTFNKIKRITSNRWLWLRNLGSTISTQTVDVLIAYPIFFYPIFGTDVWKLMVSAFVLKILMAFLDTPFMYLSYKFKPTELVK